MDLSAVSCPRCLEVRQAQGFFVVIDKTLPLCDLCAKWEADRQYFESEAYQSWLASAPVGVSFEVLKEWITTHPPPPRTTPSS